MRAGDLCKRGLLDFSPRDDLGDDLNPESLVKNAVQGSTIVATGRTLRSWSKIDSATYGRAFKKGVKFQMLINNPGALHVLPTKQLRDAKKDLPKSVEAFLRLHQQNKKLFNCRYTSLPILDGLRCAQVSLPCKPRRCRSVLIALFDINTSPGVEKMTMVWTCTCKSTDQVSDSCPAHGLRRRTQELFQKAKPLSENGW